MRRRILLVPVSIGFQMTKVGQGLDQCYSRDIHFVPLLVNAFSETVQHVVHI